MREEKKGKIRKGTRVRHPCRTRFGTARKALRFALRACRKLFLPLNPAHSPPTPRRGSRLDTQRTNRSITMYARLSRCEQRTTGKQGFRIATQSVKPTTKNRHFQVKTRLSSQVVKPVNFYSCFIAPSETARSNLVPSWRSEKNAPA